MGFDTHKNLAYSLVAVAPSPAASGTSLTVTSGQGSRFPATPFNATVWATGEIPVPTNAEIVRVTNITGDVLTITRAQEGTSARTVLVGDQIAATITAKTFTDIETQFAGTNGTVTGGSITVNSSGISISLPAYLTTAMFSDAVTLSNIRVSAGTTSNLLSAITFSNSNGLAFGLNASTITGSYTVPTVTAGSDTAGISNLGNTAGTSGVISGDQIRLLLAGGNNITLSQSINGSTATVTISAFNQTAASNTLGISNLGNTSGTSGVVSGDQIRYLFAGGNNITLSQSINGVSATVTISGANAGGAQTGISGIVVSDTTYTSGTVSFSNAGNITISSSVNGATQYIRLSGNAAQTNQSAIKAFGVSNTGNTLGNTGVSTGIDWVAAASGAITASQSTVGGGPNTVWFSVAAQSNQSAIKGLGASNTGNTAGNTGLSTGINWVLAGSNNITISQSTVGGGPNTLWVSGAAAGGAQTAISGIVVSDTTYTSGTVSFSAQANITIGSSVNGATQYARFSVAAQSNQSAIEGFGVSNTGNTLGNTGISTGIDWVIAASGAVTASQSTAAGTNTVWISVASQTNQTIGLYATGNTTHNSSTTFDARTVGTWNALGAATLGFSNGSVEVSVPATSQITGVLPVSISTAGSTISVLLNAVSEWAPYRFAGEAAVTNSTLGNSTLYFYPVDIAYPISASRLNVFISLATTTSAVNSTGAGSIGLGYGIYTRGTGASSERISQLTSYSLTLLTYTFSSNTRFGMTHYIGLSNATSHSTSTASSAAAGASNYFANSIGGYRAVALPINSTLTPGRYWIGLSHQSTTSNTNAMQVTMAAFLQMTMSNNIAFRPFGTSSAASDASVYGFYAGQGTYSGQSAAWPNSIGLSNSDIKQPINVTLPWFNISGISTTTNML